MEAYTDFAKVYDIFMDETPYEKWAKLLESLIDMYGISKAHSKGTDALETERNLVVDLGCGTGTLTELMSHRGFDMIGIDNSQEMLTIALQKKEKSGCEILYLCQDMRELDLYSTVGTIISVCDSVNYILDDDDMIQVFSKVNNYLYPGGIFIFDFNTIYKYETVIGDTTIAENRENCSFIWENYYHKEEKINEYDLTIFEKDVDTDLFHRFGETHYQRGYSVKEMQRFITAAGMETLLVLDADNHKTPAAKSQRVYIVAREHGKQEGNK